MTILDELAAQHGGNKKLSEKAGVTTEAFRQVKKGENVVGYTYKLAKKVCYEGLFKLQIVEEGHLITVSREKI